MSITQTNAWQALNQHAQSTDFNMRELFAKQPDRFQQFSITASDILLDYSKNRITQQTLNLLFDLAHKAKLPQHIEAMFAGEKINSTEQRAVLHTALRAKQPCHIMVDDVDISSQIMPVLEHMRHFTDAVRSGQWRGHTGKRITDIVNIGIGGSDLGPVMVTEALKPYVTNTINFHFVSNIDGSDISKTLQYLKPETTLFIIASKTFTTEETLTNAHTAKQWFLQDTLSNNALTKHFVALSTNTQAVTQFGIDPKNQFEFWDWVGGRYSLWSSIGLSIALAIGMHHFLELLAGAQSMDQHFQTAPINQNMPVIMGLLSIWYNNFQQATSQAIIPYDQYLHRFPAYLQQAEMESNGKQTTCTGQPVDYNTSPVIWGEPGTNGQHAFFQLLHQGTHLIPIDFILPINSHHPIGKHHTILTANCFAQSEALMRGKTATEVRQELESFNLSDDAIEALIPHKVFPGNRPSNTLLLKQVTPSSLGALIALYEHKIFVQGSIWNINSFDQWGVELGKQLAKNILQTLNGESSKIQHDDSTQNLINYFQQHKT